MALCDESFDISLNDGDLVRRCLNGEEEAYGFLVDKYKGAVHALARKKLSNYHDAQEIAQEVFIKAYQNLQKLREPDCFAGWLYVITANECRLRLKNRAREKEGLLTMKEMICQQQADHTPQQTKQHLHDAIDSLPESDRTVIHLHYFGGLTCEEISRFIGASKTAVKTRLSRARVKLKQEMTQMLGQVETARQLPMQFTLRIMERLPRLLPFSPLRPNPFGRLIPIGTLLISTLIVVIGWGLSGQETSIPPISWEGTTEIDVPIEFLSLPVSGEEIKIGGFTQRESGQPLGQTGIPKPSSSQGERNSAGLSTITQEEQIKARTVVFPSDLSMGKLYVRNQGWREEIWQEALRANNFILDGQGPPRDRSGWQELGEAKGTVAVPANQELRLQIDRFASEELSPLTALNPNDLQRLDLTYLDSDKQLIHLKGLTGLKVLNLQYANLHDVGLRHIKELTTLEELDLRETYIGDTGLKHLKQMPNLKVLNLRDTHISDTGLIHLAEHPSLQSLSLPFLIGDTGLTYLAELISLRMLDLNGAKISDAGLAHLAKLTNLSTLNISGTQISDAGLVYLKEFRSLKSLDLSNTYIGDAGLAHLKGLTSLEALNLYVTQITDEGLIHLKGPTNLKTLNLSENSIGYSDASLAPLAELTSLRVLGLYNTYISDEALARLKQTLPNCVIKGSLSSDLNPVTDTNVSNPTNTSASMGQTDMPTPRFGLSTNVVNGKIYAIGGTFDMNQALPAVEVYDPATNTWAKKTDMPSASWGHSACVINDKIYVIGGTNPNGSLSTVQVYDTATNTWSKKASMPTARYGLSTSVVDRKIYAMGGKDRHQVCSTVEMYDVATNTWTQKADMPEPKAWFSTIVVSGKIYVIGGNDGDNQSYQTVEVYEPSTDTWAEKARMPTPRSLLSANMVDGKVYAAGGWVNDNVLFATVEVYEPTTDTWTKKADIQIPRMAHAASVVNERIYVVGGTQFGGRSGFIPLRNVEAYDPVNSR